MRPSVKLNLRFADPAKAAALSDALDTWASTRQVTVRSPKARSLEEGVERLSWLVSLPTRLQAQSLLTFVQSRSAQIAGGVVSFHFCPEDGEVSDWLGCQADPRAQYQEVRF